MGKILSQLEETIAKNRTELLTLKGDRIDLLKKVEYLDQRIAENEAEVAEIMQIFQALKLDNKVIAEFLAD